MQVGDSEIRRLILSKLLNSGINITPNMLKLLIGLDNPLEKVGTIIKEVSFIPTFDGHITEQILHQIQNEEISKIIKRSSFKPYNLSDVKTDIKSSSKISNDNTIIDQSTSSIITSSKSIIKDQKNSQIHSKESKKVKPTESTKSAFRFKSKAKDYNAEWEIIKDPTGKIHTSGEYNDFYELTLDKFNRLKKLMRNREDALSATNINNILRNSQKVQVETIGLINEIRQTKKGNFLINLEDLTGSLNIIVRKDSEALEDDKIESIVEDQMIYVQGTYNPGERGQKGIIFASYITRINIRKDFKPQKSQDPLSIVLISDTHIGSREFEEKLWTKFLKFINGKIGNKNVREIASRVKYIIINGDLVDGIGVYPKQKDDLLISDIYEQYVEAAELLSQIPDHIQVFYSSGNHEPVRNAIPRPAVPKKYTEELRNKGVKCIGNPAMVKTHGVSTLIFHGDSMIDMNQLIPGLEHNKPAKTMEELLKCRHLAPIYGKKTQIAPTNTDWLVIDKIPEIFHTGHVHINDAGKYRNVTMINSGCFQTQTDFMKSFGILPTPGIIPIIELDTLNWYELNLNSHL
jgi:DNA polymerase II small subunit